MKKNKIWDMTSMVDVLRYRAIATPNKNAYIFLQNGVDEEVRLSYSELDQNVRAFAVKLSTIIKPGDRLLLLYPSGLEYIIGFFACLYAGGIAVTAYPPGLRAPSSRLISIFKDAAPKIILTTSQILKGKEKIISHSEILNSVDWIDNDQTNLEDAKLWSKTDFLKNEIAFLQYTSGSTSSPKGVIVSHKNLIENEKLIYKAFRHSPQTIVFGWLPLFHDMGLIGNMLQPVFAGATCVFTVPFAFIKNPLIWLKGIAKYKATTSGGPNFAYNLCVQRIKENDMYDIDLRSWRLAYNGSEPVHHETLKAFYKKFKKFGFAYSSFYPCYGLAEATLFVSGNLNKNGPRTLEIKKDDLDMNLISTTIEDNERKATIVSCGKIREEQNIKIVHPHNFTLCSDNQIGEIWIQGESVAKGYWNNPRKSDETFQAKIKGYNSENFLRTGDLGFITKGELYITGRIKDLIIIRGRNYYPQDIERVSEMSHSVLKPGYNAAFTVFMYGEERLVLVQGVRRNAGKEQLNEAFLHITKAVANDIEVDIYSIVFVRPSDISKTTSGKIQRLKCRKRFLSNQLSIIKQQTKKLNIDTIDMKLKSNDTNAIEKWLIHQIASLININPDEIDSNSHPAQYGFDSIHAMRQIHILESVLKVEIPISIFFESASIRKCAYKLHKLAAKKNNIEIKRKIQEKNKPSISNNQTTPLSFAQQRIWFLNQMLEDTSVYNIACALEIQGVIDVQSLKQSLEIIQRRHSTLRTVFSLKQDLPEQTVLPAPHIYLEIFDLTHLSEKAKIIKIENIKSEKSQIQFQLEDKPCWYACLIQKGSNENILLVVIHHLIADGWSMKIFVNELLKYYQSHLHNEQVTFEQLPIQYGEFVRLYNNWLEKNEISKHIFYWTKKLSKDNNYLELPVDFPRKAVQSFHGKKFLFNIPKKINEQLIKFSKHHNVTLFNTLITCYIIMLYRYTSRERINIGIPVANRNNAETKDMIGLFIDTLVITSEITENISFLDLLNMVRRTYLEALDHQNIPFSKLVEIIQPERNISHNPFFQVMFILQNAPLHPFEAGDLVINPSQIDNGTAKFELTLELYNEKNNISGWFEYNTDLFKEETIRRFVNHFQNIIITAINSPEKKIDDIQLLSDAEYNQVIREWNNTSMTVSEHETTVSLFQKQCTLRNNSIAVRFNNNNVTYQELNLFSDQLAFFLMEKGITKETIVGLHMDRSIDMVISIFAIWKAGGAYVPLDSHFPEKRLEYMINDADCYIILSHSDLADTIDAGEREIIYLNREWPSIKKNTLKATKNIQPLHPDQLAYIIYTSGSTGLPKGVEIEHKSLTNFLLSMANEPGLKSDDTLLSVTTLSFDIAALELFLPLTCGAKVVIAGKEEMNNGELLAKKMIDEDITIMQATPVTWQLLIETGWNGKNNLKALCGGEALSFDLAHTLLDKVQSLWNMYGPTETTIWSVIEKISAKDTSVLIGKPITNTQCYIVDKNNNIVPAGVAGELCIGGTGLARGYHNSETITNEKFISNPFSTNDNDRIYKTGDLARFKEDGRIQCLGRIDNQVKIRGYRIELGDIESTIKNYQNIDNVIVAVKKVIVNEKSLVAYIIPLTHKDPPDINKLKKYLKEYLPDYMIPPYYLFLDSFPLTLNGKIDRKALPRPHRLKTEEPVLTHPENQMENIISKIWMDVLNQDKTGLNENFFDAGGHSMLLVTLHKKLQERFNHKFPLVDLFTFTTIASQAHYFKKYNEKSQDNITKIQRKNIQNTEKIAVIGISCRFPGAKNYNEFWQNLCNGVESIKTFTDEELIHSGIDKFIVENPNYVKAWGVLDEADCFDARFFAYHPNEASIIDPQQRVFLEECYKSLEDAGYDPDKFNGQIGIFAGAGRNTSLAYYNNKPDELAKDYHQMISNDKDFLSTRIAYKLNLKGPAIAVQTACSTSLVAVHLACQSLLSGESDMALAGGVSIRFPQNSGYFYQEGMILSPDGHCRAFDQAASGTVGGNGAGVVVLKRLSEALKGKDHIYSIICGSAVNNDGSGKIGYTAPCISGQKDAISQAIIKSGINPDTITYIETHGTGTKLGDPVEIKALEQVFKDRKNKKPVCVLGSVKTNIGHLDIAAGIAGFIKTTLALYHKTLPATINFKNLNPEIDFTNTPFYINTELKKWIVPELPLRAGVSSFGIGGTNAHIILEESPEIEQNDMPLNTNIIPWSAKSRNALKRMNQKFIQFLTQKNNIKIHDLSYTLITGRKELEYRQAIVCQTKDAYLSHLRNNNVITSAFNSPIETHWDVIFMFTGQGSQYINMAFDLYKSEPVFKTHFDHCCSCLKRDLHIDMRELIFPVDESIETNRKLLHQTKFTQPALFAIEYSLAQLWISIGVTPSAMIGHSIGEYVAAVLAGVFSIDDALKIVSMRAGLMQSISSGSMIAVFAEEKTVKDILGDYLSIAGINSPDITIVSGPDTSINNFKKILDQKQILYKKLKTSHAFHSFMMEPVLDEFKSFLQKFHIHLPKLPFISNITGTWADKNEVCTAEYWCKQLRETVRFHDGMKELLKTPYKVFLEIGPGNTLTRLVKQHNFHKQYFIVFNSLPAPNEKISDYIHFLTILAHLWVNNVNIDLIQFAKNKPGKKISLPPYPFERNQFKKKNTQALLHKNYRSDYKDWFYVPTWKRAGLLQQSALENISNKKILIFLDDLEIGREISNIFRDSGANVLQAGNGEEYKKVSNLAFKINFEIEKDYNKLFSDLSIMNCLPDVILHLRNLTESYAGEPAEYNERLVNSFFSIINIARSVHPYLKNNRLKILVISNGLQNVLGDEKLDIEKGVLKGPVNVIHQEFPNISCLSIDFKDQLYCRQKFDQCIRQLAGEINNHILPLNPFIAYRGEYRWIQEYEKINPDECTNDIPKIKDGGVYLITGGSGGLGLVFTKYIAESVHARIILTTKRQFPEKDEWISIINKSNNGSAKHKIEEFVKIEKQGSRIEVLQADVTSYKQMENVFGHIEKKYGRLDGIIHMAGAAGEGLINFKNIENQKKVLKPKVQGTLLLDTLLKEKQIDFFILFSSVTSILGGIGQADYSAANAFMDSYAQAAILKNKDRLTTSINWDTWKEVGMAVGSQNEKGLTFHPLIKKVIKTNNTFTYISTLSHKEWVVNEHWILGNAIVPGTTFLEIVYAAIDQQFPGHWIEFKNIYFLTPLSIKEKIIIELYTTLVQNNNKLDFIIKSQDPELHTNQWYQHAKGTIHIIEKRKPDKNDLEQLLSSCNIKEILNPLENAYSGKIVQKNREKTYQDQVVFGPRWNNIKWIRLGKNRGIARLELKEDFKEDTSSYWLHPALLDCAVGFLRLFNYEGIYLPLSYQKMTIMNRLPGKIYSYAQIAEGSEFGKRALNIDIKVLDENGYEIITIEKFSMIETDMTNFGSSLLKAYSVTPPEIKRKKNHFLDYIQKENIKNGIRIDEGKKVWDKILQLSLPQVIVSTRDFKEQLHKYRDLHILKQIDNKGSEKNRGDNAEDNTIEYYPRPELKTDYVSPKTETGKKLAFLWQRLLGIETIGIYDDFFELGGDSLLLIQLHKELQESFEKDISVVDLYKYTTISALRKYYIDNSHLHQLDLKRIDDRVLKKKEVIKKRRKKTRLR